jgi:hypothetical protein
MALLIINIPKSYESPDYFFELDAQTIPRTPETYADLAESVPLHDLEADAPTVPPHSLSNVLFSFSNDESAEYYNSLRARTHTESYRAATNRVALVIGEAALSAALPLIPEETIIVLDSSRSMIGFMNDYVKALRTAPKAQDFYTMLGMGKVSDIHSMPKATRMAWGRVAKQYEFEWGRSKLYHPAIEAHKELGDSSDSSEPPVEIVGSFSNTQKIARQKAIIPWLGNIGNIDDMNILAEQLRQRDAHITLMNLTNALPLLRGHTTCDDVAKVLKCLPITPDAPIMTTSFEKVYRPENRFRQGYIVEASGPFFGLDNLARHGGPLDRFDTGKITTRKYFDEDGTVFPQ